MIEGISTIRLQNSEHRPHLVAIRLGNSHGSPIQNEECTRKEDLKHVIYKPVYSTQTADGLGRFAGSQGRYSVESRREQFGLRTDGESGRESSPLLPPAMYP